MLRACDWCMISLIKGPIMQKTLITTKYLVFETAPSKNGLICHDFMSRVLDRPPMCSLETVREGRKWSAKYPSISITFLSIKNRNVCLPGRYCVYRLLWSNSWTTAIGGYNIGKSSQTFFPDRIHSNLVSCASLLKLCIELGSDIILICAKSQNDLQDFVDVIGDRRLARFE